MLLNQASILVAEDETFIALELEYAITDAGGQVVGPAASVRDALALLANTEISGAILDVNLIDGDCCAIVEALTARNIPMVLQSGLGLPAFMSAKFPGLVAHAKPCRASALVAQVAALINEPAIPTLPSAA